MRKLALCAVLLGWGILTSVSTPAAQEPLWEIGGGIGVASIPDYRGSDERHTYVLPIPYFVYRGDRFKVDRGGVRSDLVQTDGAVLDISVNLGPPAKSDKNQARAGMPDLDPVIEAGPSVQWLLYANQNRDRKLALLLPMHAVMTTRFEYIGWLFSPRLNVDFLNLGPGSGWDLGAAVGPLYASEKYHDYYYEVRQEFATPTRPVYEARAGYSGSRVTLSLSKHFPSFWVGAFARYDRLNGAVFEDSPLMRTDHSLMAGFGVSWIFARSPERVEVKSEFINP